MGNKLKADHNSVVIMRVMAGLRHLKRSLSIWNSSSLRNKNKEEKKNLATLPAKVEDFVKGEKGMLAERK